MKKTAYSSLLLVAFLAAACVPQQQYAELEQTLKYYKSEALASDSIRAVNALMQNQQNQNTAEYQELVRSMEELTATNISLNRNYQDIVGRYNALVGENQRVLAATSYETTALEQELALRRDELAQKERSLYDMEYQLRQRETELDQLEARSPASYEYSGAPDARFQALRSQKASQNQRLANLTDYFRRVLVGFPEGEITIANRNGGVSLVLAKSLLFAQGDEQIYWKGRQALQQIAVVLRENPDLQVQIISHTNPGVDADTDWLITGVRATTVAKDMALYGVDPSRVMAAAKGGNQPLVPPTNADAEQRNSRTEFFIPLDYTILLNQLD